MVAKFARIHRGASFPRKTCRRKVLHYQYEESVLVADEVSTFVVKKVLPSEIDI